MSMGPNCKIRINEIHLVKFICYIYERDWSELLRTRTIFITFVSIIFTFRYVVDVLCIATMFGTS